MRTNPKRPPKKWWRDCVAGVSESGSADDPESVCGALWYQKMSESQRRRLLANQSEGETLLIAAGVLGAIGLWFWSRSKKKKEATATTTPPVQQLAPLFPAPVVQGPYSFVPGARQ
jgi:hypothetical protein